MYFEWSAISSHLCSVSKVKGLELFDIKYKMRVVKAGPRREIGGSVQ